MKFRPIGEWIDHDQSSTYPCNPLQFVEVLSSYGYTSTTLAEKYDWQKVVSYREVELDFGEAQ